MCRILKCSKSGYYDWVKRLNCEDRDDIIADLIFEWQEKAEYIYGYRRIKVWLLFETWLIISHKTVLLIMPKYNLMSKILRKRRHNYYSKKITYS